jgi:hypothetical protein
MVTNLQLAFGAGKIKIVNSELGDMLRRELLAYTYKYSELTKHIHYDHPAGGHDDLVDALLLAWTNMLDKMPKLKQYGKYGYQHITSKVKIDNIPSVTTDVF